eukprot:CAMPEP_0115875764 /NCGR_PEP_ID=MMETSP0287-20121206/25283_1 /TAXON_ID=412157 /ORGANISM="Chrysochromulina rotalis, Strain UIO044" /LENGTH=118 /DNA_ID=CAMNT_0003331073 /DNA_START=539 /DNA_END=895 /DNA_ORIENTATION=-
MASTVAGKMPNTASTATVPARTIDAERNRKKREVAGDRHRATSPAAMSTSRNRRAVKGVGSAATATSAGIQAEADANKATTTPMPVIKYPTTAASWEISPRVILFDFSFNEFGGDSKW